MSLIQLHKEIEDLVANGDLTKAKILLVGEDAKKRDEEADKLLAKRIKLESCEKVVESIRDALNEEE